MQLYPLQIPVVMLQSTENTLVNASNVDSFLVVSSLALIYMIDYEERHLLLNQGRNCKHLWSHMLNILSDATLSQAADVTGQWVVSALHANTYSSISTCSEYVNI